VKLVGAAPILAVPCSRSTPLCLDRGGLGPIARAKCRAMRRLFLTPIFVLFAGCTPAQDINQSAADLAREQPKWLFSASENACPADVMSDQPAPIRYLGEACVTDPKKCVEGCKAGNSNDCFAMALAVEPIRGHTKLADRLFYRACSLGVVSACSNRASSMSSNDSVCQVRTYEKACNRRDAWACLTLGMYLARGMGVDRDLPRARKLITESCELVDDEEWCAYGLDMLMEIDKIEKKQRDRMIQPDAGSDPLLRR
jgi:hypothetical protein